MGLVEVPPDASLVRQFNVPVPQPAFHGLDDCHLGLFLTRFVYSSAKWLRLNEVEADVLKPKPDKVACGAFVARTVAKDSFAARGRKFCLDVPCHPPNNQPNECKEAQAA